MRLWPGVTNPASFQHWSFRCVSSISDLATGDFDNDGIPDLVAAGGPFPSKCDSFTVYLGLGQAEFGPPLGNNLVGTGVFSVLVVDLDSDSIQDLVLVNSWVRAVHLFSGNGDGTFSFAGELPTDDDPVAAVAEDFNRDGFLDIAIATNGFAHFIKIYFGQSDGAFSEPVLMEMDISGFFNLIASSDFNLDGVPDLVVTANQSATILLGQGDGQFQASLELDLTYIPSDIAIADFDGNGTADLAWSYDAQAAVNLEVFLGTGIDTELFEPSIRYVTGGDRSESLVASDINQDGVLDLLVSNRGSNDISVMPGHGNGTFMVGPNVPAYLGPRSIATSDFNQDGKPDFATICGDSDEIVVVLGDNTENFSLLSLDAGDSEPTSEAKPDSVVSGDFNNDGFLDLVTVNAAPGTLPTTISILINKRNEEFYPQTTIGQFDEGASLTSAQTADFNSDGNLDVAAIIRTENIVRVMLGRGDGSFDPAVEFEIDGDQPLSLVAKDLNGDSIPDIATANVSSDDVSFLLGTGNGGFVPMPSFPLANGPSQLLCGDFNNDLVQDLVVSCLHSNDVHVLLGNGLGEFVEVVFDEFTNIGTATAVSDYDKDGNLDLLIADNPGRIVVLNGLGNGEFFPSQCIETLGVITRLQAVDMNNDGATDLVALIGSGADRFELFLHNGTGGFVLEDSYPCGGTPRCLLTADLNNDGFADVVTANNESFDVTVLFNQLGDATALIGDVNCDGMVNLLDVGPFVALIVSQQYQAEGDINGDGLVNLFDVGPFTELLLP